MSQTESLNRQLSSQDDMATLLSTVGVASAPPRSLKNSQIVAKSGRSSHAAGTHDRCSASMAGSHHLPTIQVR